PGAQRRMAHCYISQNERRNSRGELQPRQLSARHARAAIIEIGHLGAEIADVNWKVFQKLSGLTSELVQHRQDLLRFAQRENRDEDARAALESSLECLCKPSLFAGPCPAPGLVVVGSRRAPDQRIDLFPRYTRASSHLFSIGT